MRTCVVERGSWVEDGVLGEKEYFGDVQREESRTFYAGLQAVVRLGLVEES